MANDKSGKAGDIRTIGGTKVASITGWNYRGSIVVNPSVTSDTEGYTQKGTGAKDASGSFTYQINVNRGINFTEGDRFIAHLMADQNTPTDYIECQIVIAERGFDVDIMTGGPIGGAVPFEVDSPPAPVFSGIFAAGAPSP